MARFLLLFMLFIASAVHATVVDFPGQGRESSRYNYRKITAESALLCEYALIKKTLSFFHHAPARLGADSRISVKEIRDIGYGVTAFIAEEVHVDSAADGVPEKSISRQHLMIWSQRTGGRLLYYNIQRPGTTVEDLAISPSGQYVVIQLKNDVYDPESRGVEDRVQLPPRSVLKFLRIRPGHQFTGEGERKFGSEFGNPDAPVYPVHALARLLRSRMMPQIHELGVYDYIGTLDHVIHFDWSPVKDQLLLSSWNESGPGGKTMAEITYYEPTGPQDHLFIRNAEHAEIVRDVDFLWSDGGRFAATADLVDVPAGENQLVLHPALLVFTLDRPAPVQAILFDDLSPEIARLVGRNPLEVFSLKESMGGEKLTVFFGNRDVTELLRPL